MGILLNFFDNAAANYEFLGSRRSFSAYLYLGIASCASNSRNRPDSVPSAVQSRGLILLANATNSDCLFVFVFENANFR